MYGEGYGEIYMPANIRVHTRIHKCAALSARQMQLGNCSNGGQETGPGPWRSKKLLRARL